MLLNEIKKHKWIKDKSPKKGRWNGSGDWNYSGKWLKGQKARTWHSLYPWFEWGQTPLIQKLPKKRWFWDNLRFKKNIAVINLEKIESDNRILDWDHLSFDKFMELWYCDSKNYAIKILWKWKLEKKVEIKWEKIQMSETVKKILS